MQHAAYTLAMEEKVDCMEIDASRTADGVLVAIHDRWVSNILELRGNHYSQPIPMEPWFWLLSNMSRIMMSSLSGVPVQF
jgi:glycerophosphoryl diester phosphodiesterase